MKILKTILLTILVITLNSCSKNDELMADCECVQYIKGSDGKLTEWGTSSGKCVAESVGMHVFKEKCN